MVALGISTSLVKYIQILSESKVYFVFKKLEFRVEINYVQ